MSIRKFISNVFNTGNTKSEALIAMVEILKKEFGVVFFKKKRKGGKKKIEKNVFTEIINHYFAKPNIDALFNENIRLRNLLLALAFHTNNYEKIQKILDINKKYLTHPMHLCVASNNTNYLRLLLEHGSTQNDIFKCLKSCFKRDKHECFQVLLDFGIDLKEYVDPENYFTPIHIIVSEHARKCLKLLIDRKCDIDIGIESDNCTALALCAEIGKTDCAELLLNAKADMNIESSNGERTS